MDSLFHQYYERDKKSKDIITICTAPWRRCKEESFTPVCCATRFTATKTPDDVYWIGVMPIWKLENNTDGIRYDLNLKEIDLLRPEDIIKYEDIVEKDTRFTTVSINLLDVTTSDDINTKLIDMLLIP